MQPKDFFAQLDERSQVATSTSQRQTDLKSLIDPSEALKRAMNRGFNQLAYSLTQHEPSVTVKNQITPPTSVKTPDVQNVVDAVEKLITIAEQEDNQPLLDAVAKLQTTLDLLPSKINIPEVEPTEEVRITNLIDYSGKFESLETAVKGIKIPEPKINLKPTISVNNDLPKLEDIDTGLQDLLKAVQDIKIPKPVLNTKPVEEAIAKVYEAISGLTFPVPNYVLPFKDATGKAVQVLVNADGTLPGGAPSIFRDYDDVLFSNPDANGYMQTAVYSLAGVTKWTLSFTWNATGTATHIARA